MSLYMMAAGVLISDPQRREGAKGPFTTATIRANGDEAVFVSIVAFGDEAGRLLEFAKGDALAVSGRARLTSWTGRDGAERHGVSVTAEQIISVKPRSKSAAGTRRHTRSPCASLRPMVSDLPQDRADDLYAEPVP